MLGRVTPCPVLLGLSRASGSSLCALIVSLVAVLLLIVVSSTISNTMRTSEFLSCEVGCELEAQILSNQPCRYGGNTMLVAVATRQICTVDVARQRVLLCTYFVSLHCRGPALFRCSALLPCIQ
jgi:hypothetical protein